MLLVKCKACGKRYDYHKDGCCPHCGAYNRPPRRDRVEADGTVRHLSDAEFFGHGKKAQNGKVCFEQDVCYEEQARRVRHTGPEEPISSSPFDNVSRPKRKKENEGGADRRKKLIRTIAIVVVLVNLLPLSLTMCSFSDMMTGIEDIFDVEVGESVVLPDTPPSDGEAEYTADIGNTFIWWDNDAAVVDVMIDQQGGTTFLELTMWRVEAYDEPVIYYTTSDGWLEKAGCEAVEAVTDELYAYSYVLDDYEPGGECYAYFDGYNDNVYCEVKVSLAETPIDDSVTAAMAEMGMWVPFGSSDVIVYSCDLTVVGSVTQVELEVEYGDGDLGVWPMFCYTTTDGEEVWAEARYVFESDCATFLYQAMDMDPEALYYASFEEEFAPYDTVQIALN